MIRASVVMGGAVLAAGLAACSTSHGAPQRPIWDGWGTPPSVPAGTMLLCPASDAGNGARLTAGGPVLVCVIDGRQYVWSVQK